MCHDQDVTQAQRPQSTAGQTSTASTALTARSRRTRAALIDAVVDELRASASFDAIAVAERAGCSPATFYSHFGAKSDALAAGFASVLDELAVASMAALDADALDELGLDKAVAVFVEQQADFFRRESLVFRVALAALPENRAVRDAYRHSEARVLEHLDGFLHKAIDGGHVRPGPVEVMAEAVLVLAQGINNPRALRPANAAVRSEIAAAIVAMLSPLVDRTPS